VPGTRKDTYLIYENLLKVDGIFLLRYNKAPSMFLTILDNKLKYNETRLYKIDSFNML